MDPIKSPEFIVAVEVGGEVIVLEQQQSLIVYVCDMVLMGKADDGRDLVEWKRSVSFTTIEAV